MKRRIRHQKAFQEAWFIRISAAKLKRRRRAVAFRIAGIGRQVRCDFEGDAGERVQADEAVVAVKLGARAELVRHPNVGDVQPCAARGADDAEKIRSRPSRDMNFALVSLPADVAVESLESAGRLGDGVGRDKVPIDGVAECFVDAHSVLIDSNPLRGALQRRSSKAAIAQVLDEGVTLDVRQTDAWDAMTQCLHYGKRRGTRDCFRRQGLGHAGNLVAVDARSRDR